MFDSVSFCPCAGWSLILIRRKSKKEIISDNAIDFPQTAKGLDRNGKGGKDKQYRYELIALSVS